jgi:hypothetical protein
MPTEYILHRNSGYLALQAIPGGKGQTTDPGGLLDRLLDEASEIVDELLPDEEPPPDDSTSWEDDSTSWEDDSTSWEDEEPPPPPPPAETVSSMTASIIGVAIIGAIGWVLLS